MFVIHVPSFIGFVINLKFQLSPLPPKNMFNKQYIQQWILISWILESMNPVIRVSVCPWIHVSMYPCIHLPCIHVSIYHVSMYPRIHVSMYPSINVSMYLCIQVFMYLCIQVFMYPCIYVSKYSCIYVSRYPFIHVLEYPFIHLYIRVCVNVSRVSRVYIVSLPQSFG